MCLHTFFNHLSFAVLTPRLKDDYIINSLSAKVRTSDVPIIKKIYEIEEGVLVRPTDKDNGVYDLSLLDLLLCCGCRPST